MNEPRALWKSVVDFNDEQMLTVVEANNKDKPHSEAEQNEERKVHADIMSGKRSCLQLRVMGETDDDNRPWYFFFDLDNTLYSKSHGIGQQMLQRICLYFQTRLNLPAEESAQLGRRYYLDYGLAIRGVIREFDIDPLDYDAFVDGGLEFGGDFGPPAGLLEYLRELRGVAHLWIFTNAGLFHARRVMGLLGLAHEECNSNAHSSSLFDGIIYCDYAEPDFPAKPDRLAYERAMQCAGVQDPSRCLFVDDAPSNVLKAREMGWRAILLDEHNEYGHCDGVERIGSLSELYRLCNPKDLLHL